MGRGETPGAQSALGLSLPRCDRAGSMYPASPPRVEPAVKIAVLHNLPSGGGKRALYYHVRGLVERGHSVEAWCPSTSDRNYLPLSEVITEHVAPIDIRQRCKSVARSPLLGEMHGNEWREAKALDEHCRRCADEINSGG